MLKIAFDPIYKHSLKIGHRFPMEKYELLPEHLLRKNICNSDNFFSPLPIKKKLLLSTHDEGYYNNLINLSLSKLDTRQIGFPLSEALIKREHVIAQGTIQNTHYAQQHGVSMNIAGGTHHAFRDRPGAFCMLNDQAIASNYLIDNNLAKRVMIVDLEGQYKLTINHLKECIEMYKNYIDLYWVCLPIHLRNAPTKLMKELGYGEDYKYSHDYANNFAEQEFLPDEISETKLYNPGDNAREIGTREFLKNRWKDKYGY